MDNSPWLPFPDPRRGDFLQAPYGPGLYELRNRATGELVLFGIGANCAERMSSILPEPYGCGRRRNCTKREYVLANLKDIEYRCRAFSTRDEAKAAEDELRQLGKYLFQT
jgi:hypothetical protein